MPVVPGTGGGVSDGGFNSTIINAQIVTPLDFLLARPLAQMYSAANQSVPHNVWTSLTFDTEDVDSANGHDNVTNPSRYVAQYPGYYRISCIAGYAANATGRRGVRLAVNGTPWPGTSVSVAATSGQECSVANDAHLVYLAVGDYVEAQGLQTSGAALNTAASTLYNPSMSVLWERT